MEMTRNPELMREMMRHTDRAMSNIEALPEGFNHLRRMYTDIQEPMMDAATNSPLFAGPPANQPAQTPAQQPRTPPSTTPNTQPLPNPWAPGGSTGSGSGTGSSLPVPTVPTGSTGSGANSATPPMFLPGFSAHCL